MRKIVVVALILTLSPLAVTVRAHRAVATEPAAAAASGAAPRAVLDVPADFNGDGFPDVAIGVPHDSGNDVLDAGGVNVMYGSAGGLQVNDPVDQRFTEGTSEVKGEPQSGDLFGAAVAVGDYNADGFSDLAVGAPGEAAGTDGMAGRVGVLYGTAMGLQAATPDDQQFTQGLAGLGDEAEAGDAFGDALAAGDFDGDGFADLAVGAPGDRAGGHDGAGAVVILYGGVFGLQTVDDDEFWTQNSPEVRGKSGEEDSFGDSLAAGDFDGDGFDDLGVGVTNELVSGLDEAGSVAVFYGGPGGIQAVNRDDQLWDRNDSGVEDVAAASDKMGWSVTAGDFNGDRNDDLAVGVARDDVGGEDNVGSVSVFYGSGAGLQATSPNDQVWSQDSRGVRGSSDKGDHLGEAVAVGDFDGDGFDDLGIGVPDEDVADRAGSGTTNVLYGTTTGLQADSPDDQQWHQDSTGVKGRPEVGDSLGAALAAADFNADGFADLVIGLPGELAGGAAGAGALQVLYGKGGGLQADDPDDDHRSQGSVGVEGNAEVGDAFASSLAA